MRVSVAGCAWFVLGDLFASTFPAFNSDTWLDAQCRNDPTARALITAGQIKCQANMFPRKVPKTFPSKFAF